MTFFMTRLEFRRIAFAIERCSSAVYTNMKQLLLEAHLFQYPCVTMVTQPCGLKDGSGRASKEKPHTVILDVRDQLRDEGRSRMN